MSDGAAYSGTTADYVGTEPRQVSEVGCSANDPMVGQPVLAVRMNLGPKDPSKVLILGLCDAVLPCGDLQRILADWNGQPPTDRRD